jgi:hypothetical protein
MKQGDSLIVKRVHKFGHEDASEEFVAQASYVEDFVITTKTGTVYKYNLVSGKSFSRYCQQIRGDDTTNLEDYAYVYKYNLVSGKSFSRYCQQIRGDDTTNLEDYAYVSLPDVMKLQALILDPTYVKNPNKLQGMLQVFREKDFRGAPGRLVYLADYRKRICTSGVVEKEPVITKREIALY